MRTPSVLLACRIHPSLLAHPTGLQRPEGFAPQQGSRTAGSAPASETPGMDGRCRLWSLGSPGPSEQWIGSACRLWRAFLLACSLQWTSLNWRGRIRHPQFHRCPKNIWPKRTLGSCSLCPPGGFGFPSQAHTGQQLLLPIWLAKLSLPGVS